VEAETMTNGRTGPLLRQLRQLAADASGETDSELLAQFVSEQEEAAFEALVRRHGPMVLRVGRRVLSNPHDADDVFQATFLTLARRAASIRKQQSVAAWLYGVAYRIAIKARAEAARRQARQKPRPVTSPPDPLSALTGRELCELLDVELNNLPGKCRAAWILCHLEDMTQDQAAQQLGLSLATLKRRLEQSRELLRSRLSRRGIALSAVLSAAAITEVAAAPLPVLVVPTVQAALSIASGMATAGVVTPRIAAMTEGAVHAMFIAQLRKAIVFLLALGIPGTGLTMLIKGTRRADAVETIRQGPEQKPASPEPDRADRGRPIRTLSGHKDRVTSVAYASDGRWIATAGWDGTVRLWDAQTGKEVRCLDMPATRDYPTAHLSQILFSPGNEFVVVAQQAAPNEPGVIVWNPRTGKKVYEFPAGVGSVAISPDGKLIACGGFGVIRLHELATGKVIHEMNGQQTHMQSLTFSPDGKTLASMGPLPRPQRGDGLTRLGFMPDVLRVWDVATGKERPSVFKELVLGGLPGQRHALSPDGRTLAHLSSSAITLRETATGGQRAKLIGHTDDVCTVTFSLDGRTLASGSMDGTVRLWDLPSGKEVGRFGKEVPKKEDPRWVLAIAFSPDGRTLVAGGLDQAAQIWDISRVMQRRREPAERSPAALEADWKDLAGDAAAGYAALGRLVSSPGAVAFLGKQLQSMKPVDTKRIEQLIADLNDERFQVREQARKELTALDDLAASFLQKALAAGPPLETRLRLETLLNRLDGASPSAETLRQIRAVEALESIGNAEAQRLLDKLAAGRGETRLTQEARAAAGRLSRRGSVAP
jgi:RNA polymerase sigma factor (sigma-70 family)